LIETLPAAHLKLVYPKNRARFAQAFAILARTEAVRADHRLRTNDEAIRAQSTICGLTVFGMAKSLANSPLLPVYPKTAFSLYGCRASV
jgi:hypothetical protein